MSLKPTKITDQNKEWYRRRDALSKRVRIQPEYHLIVTEGIKTEPQYFEALKNHINKNFKGHISMKIYGTGNNTVNVFEKAKELATKSPNGFKYVWIVYDTDDFLAENINKVVELCNSNSSEQTVYHALWSNQCIELWYLLHFSYFQSDIKRKEYYPKLTQQLKRIKKGEYKKNRDDMFDILKPYINTAIANAEKLADENKSKTPTQSAPGTEVFRIIKMLKPYLDS